MLQRSKKAAKLRFFMFPAKERFLLTASLTAFANLHSTTNQHHCSAR